LSKITRTEWIYGKTGDTEWLANPRESITYSRFREDVTPEMNAMAFGNPIHIYVPSKGVSDSIMEFDARHAPVTAIFETLKAEYRPR
jgi:hypothetical protein